MRVTKSVSNGDQLHTLEFTDYPSVMSSHHSQTDKAHAQ